MIKSLYDKILIKIARHNNHQYGPEPDQLLKILAMAFIELPSSEIDETIQNELAELAAYCHADRCYIYLFQNKRKNLKLTHQFRRPNTKSKISEHQRVDSQDFSWLLEPLLNNSTVYIESPSKLPPKASTIRAIMEAEKSKAMLLCPLHQQQNINGIIGLDFVHSHPKTIKNSETLLQGYGRIFGSAIRRLNCDQSPYQREEKLQRLFADIEEVIFISTPEGKFLEVNPAGVKLLGYESEAELLKIDIERDLYADPEDRKKYQAIMQKEGQVKDYELTLKNKQGKKIYVSVTANTVHDEDGNITAYQGIFRDITYKRELEQQLFQAKKMESIGLLAGGIAHDFNNILTTIGGYAELVMMNLNKDQPSYEDVQNIIGGVKRAEDLIHQLLAFGRRQMIEAEVVDMNIIISELHSMLARLISEDIKFELKLKEHLPCIKADPVQIQQILVNLVVNANQAIHKREKKSKDKKICIMTDKINITKELLMEFPGIKTGKHIIFSVQDTGKGMDKDTRQNIFEPFFSTKKEGEGTGLGLATIYGIVKQNEANIYVESEPGKGSTFSIYWPATDEKLTKEPVRETEIQFRDRSETILFVEDDLHVRELFCNALSSFGYQIFQAENGIQAMELVKQKSLARKIDLVISDIVMPEMGGEELADTLRKLNPDLNILLCSGFTDSRISVQETYHNNGYHFLAKPYTIHKLEKMIRSILTAAN